MGLYIPYQKQVKRMTIGAIVSVFIFLTAALLWLRMSPATFAVTPPSACFSFYAPSGTLDAYYANENNDPMAPACPLNVDIPAQIDGADVRIVGDGSFRNTYISSITFPSTVTYIGDYAFENGSLTSISFPSGLTYIGYGAFANNQIGGTVTIPAGVITINDTVFSGNRITAVSLPGGVTNIGVRAFADNQLTSITLPTSVTSLKSNAFTSNKLTTVTLPSGMTTFGDEVFSENLLTSVTIPQGITNIPNGTFMGNKITNLTLPEGLTSIGPNAFRNNQIASLELPNSLVAILSQAFYENNLTVVHLPASVALIQGDVFALQHPSLTVDEYRALVSSTDSADITRLRDSIEYVQMYTQDPTNPNYFRDDITLTCLQYDGDVCTNIRNDGGYLINPALMTSHYVDEQDATIRADAVATGPSIAGMNYRVTSGPALTAADPELVTPAERAANLALLAAAYYRLGTTIDVSAPVISGYVQPNPSTRRVTLSDARTETTFIYTRATPPTTPPDTGAPNTPSAPSTGLQRMVGDNGMILGVVALVLSVVLAGMFWFRSRHKA